MPMKIFIDVEEAAERLEELIDLACRQDEVYVCRAGWPVAQLSSFSGGDDSPQTKSQRLFLTRPTARAANWLRMEKSLRSTRFGCSLRKESRGGNMI